MKKIVLSAIMLLGLQLAIMSITTIRAMSVEYAWPDDPDEYALPDDDYEGYYDE